LEGIGILTEFVIELGMSSSLFTFFGKTGQKTTSTARTIRRTNVETHHAHHQVLQTERMRAKDVAQYAIAEPAERSDTNRQHSDNLRL
jgi:hypothetical protein